MEYLEIIEKMKKKMFEAVEGIYSGDCKNLTVLRLEEAFDFLKQLEDLARKEVSLR